MRERSRNLKALSVSAEFVLSLFAWNGRPPAEITLPVCPEVPTDAVIEDIRYAWEMRAFEVLVSHPTFPTVPDGEVVPRFAANWERRVFALSTGPDEPVQLPRELR